MKEPVIHLFTGQAVPFSEAPVYALKNVLNGRAKFTPDEDGEDPDVDRRYAAILLRERGQ